MDTIKKRQEEATSKETLADVESSEELSDTDDTAKPTAPSPDGAFDEDDELKNADPI